MNLSDLGKLVTKYGAPLLGGILGGPAGMAIGQLVGSEFGMDLSTDDGIKSIADKLIGDPTVRVKLAEIEANNKLELQRLFVSNEKDRLDSENASKALDIENTKDARANNTKNPKNYFPEILSFLIVIGFFMSIFWVAAYTQDEGDHDVLYLLLGVIGTSFSAVVNYWIGSSYDKVTLKSK